MTSVGICKHLHWERMFDCKGFMTEEVCVSCGLRRLVEETFSTGDTRVALYKGNVGEA